MKKQTLNNQNYGSRLIIALDFASENEALKFSEKIDPKQCKVKVGKELFTRAGPNIIKSLRNMGFDIFLDLKFHDIPNTVAKACGAACDLGVWMLNVHTLGGPEMLKAAHDAVSASSQTETLLIGVTILTSHSQQSLSSIGLNGSIGDNVARLANLAQESGLQGVVCSAHEVNLIRKTMLSNFITVTPGIRPTQACVDDQIRVMTPYDAIINGSSYLVMGRPITQAADSMAVIDSVNLDISAALE